MRTSHDRFREDQPPAEHVSHIPYNAHLSWPNESDNITFRFSKKGITFPICSGRSVRSGVMADAILATVA